MPPSSNNQALTGCSVGSVGIASFSSGGVNQTRSQQETHLHANLNAENMLHWQPDIDLGDLNADLLDSDGFSHDFAESGPGEASHTVTQEEWLLDSDIFWSYAEVILPHHLRAERQCGNPNFQDSSTSNNTDPGASTVRGAYLTASALQPQQLVETRHTIAAVCKQEAREWTPPPSPEGVRTWSLYRKTRAFASLRAGKTRRQKIFQSEADVLRLIPIEVLSLNRLPFNEWDREHRLRANLSSKEQKILSVTRRKVLARKYAKIRRDKEKLSKLENLEFE